MASTSQLLGYDLYVQPTYVVQIPQYNYPAGHSRQSRQARYTCPLCGQAATNVFEILFKATGESKYGCVRCQSAENLTNNQRQDHLSRKADKRLKNAVNWLVASAKFKSVYSKQDGVTYKFKINFITLTLPTTNHNITDKHFTGVMLNKLINALYYNCKLKNYVWKVEAQQNGNIHCHLLTDTFVHHVTLRKIWNKILTKEGLIYQYKKQFSSMDLQQYIQYRLSQGSSDTSRIAAAFKQGQESNWENPNTTDVHSIKKVKDIAAYISKYMSKSETDRRVLKCRLWACSQSLSEKNKLHVFTEGWESCEVLASLAHESIEQKPIESKPNHQGTRRIIGKIFFIQPKMWGTIITGKLLELYNEHRFYIRNGITHFKEANQFLLST